MTKITLIQAAVFSTVLSFTVTPALAQNQGEEEGGFFSRIFGLGQSEHDREEGRSDRERETDKRQDEEARERAKEREETAREWDKKQNEMEREHAKKREEKSREWDQKQREMERERAEKRREMEKERDEYRRDHEENGRDHAASKGKKEGWENGMPPGQTKSKSKHSKSKGGGADQDHEDADEYAEGGEAGQTQQPADSEDILREMAKDKAVRAAGAREGSAEAELIRMGTDAVIDRGKQ